MTLTPAFRKHHRLTNLSEPQAENPGDGLLLPMSVTRAPRLRVGCLSHLPRRINFFYKVLAVKSITLSYDQDSTRQTVSTDNTISPCWQKLSVSFLVKHQTHRVNILKMKVSSFGSFPFSLTQWWFYEAKWPRKSCAKCIRSNPQCEKLEVETSSCCPRGPADKCYYGPQ